jgi:carbamoyltransferase
VLLGDSYTAGHGVNNSDRFSDLLEKSYPNLDVMNFGLSGTGTDQQLLIYETLAKPFEGDAYIFAPFYNNIVRNELHMSMMVEHRTGDVWFRAKPYFTVDGGRLVLHNQPVPNELVSEKEAVERLAPLERWNLGETKRVMPQWMLWNLLVNKIFLSLVNPYSGYESESSQSWRLMRAIIERFIKQVDGKPVFLVPLPEFRHFAMGLTPTYLGRFAELQKKNCFVMDLLPYFKRLSPEDRRNCRFVNDTHYSPLAHRVVADAISDGLATHCSDILK